jgi:membrane-bound lytic murein transglycosylase D
MVETESQNVSSASATTQTPKATQTSTTQASATKTAEYGTYKIKSGDSFYTIAKRYPGYSQNDLMKLNNTKSSQLKVGQYIKVPKQK